MNCISLEEPRIFHSEIFQNRTVNPTYDTQFHIFFLLANMDRGLLSGLLLIDLKKAFDLVNHSTLLFKLGVYGCSPSALKWFNSYLAGRSQKTSFKGALSDSLPMSVGIPQRSILGPLFFLAFINDLPLYLSSTFDTNLAMFADDTTIFTSAKA